MNRVLSQLSQCQGVMVSNDVVLFFYGCPLAAGAQLSVGDYDPLNNESVQVREFEEYSSENFLLSFSLAKIEPVTMPGFAPVQIISDPFSPVQGTNITVVGYGATDTWREEQPASSETAREVTLQIIEQEYCTETNPLPDYLSSYYAEGVYFCAAALHSQGPFRFGPVGPCRGMRSMFHFVLF
jgi:Trypsin